MGASQFQRDREAPTGLIGSDAVPAAQESETLRARIAGELRSVERLQRVARPAALIVFALLGLLAILQLYTWMRLEQLTALSQQREERTAAALASMQEAIDKHKASSGDAIPETAKPSHSRKKADLVVKETTDRGSVAAPRPQPKPVRAGKDPKPAHKTATVTAPVRPVPEQPAAARQAPAPPQALAPPQDPPAMRPKSTIAYQNSTGNRWVVFTNRPEASPQPAGQDSSAHQGPEVAQNDQHEVADAPVTRSGRADTVIARDHDEIERLRKLGKRDYIEFTLARSGSRQEVAPDIRLELRKVDSKRLRCTLSIYSEDYEYPTDLGINEPVVFPVRAMWESVELVINKVGKDAVGGYLTARKGVLEAR